MKVKLEGVQETLLIPLVVRAMETQRGCREIAVLAPDV